MNPSTSSSFLTASSYGTNSTTASTKITSKNDENKIMSCILGNEKERNDYSFQDMKKATGPPGLLFPVILHKMLQESPKLGHEQIISWLPNGRAFKIYDRDEFVEKVLPIYYDPSSSSSNDYNKSPASSTITATTSSGAISSTISTTSSNEGEEEDTAMEFISSSTTSSTTKSSLLSLASPSSTTTATKKQFKWKSFLRQINLYGFERITKSSHKRFFLKSTTTRTGGGGIPMDKNELGAYAHNLFNRDNEALCCFIQRKDGKSKIRRFLPPLPAPPPEPAARPPPSQELSLLPSPPAVPSSSPAPASRRRTATTPEARTRPMPLLPPSSLLMHSSSYSNRNFSINRNKHHIMTNSSFASFPAAAAAMANNSGILETVTSTSGVETTSYMSTGLAQQENYHHEGDFAGGGIVTTRKDDPSCSILPPSSSSLLFSIDDTTPSFSWQASSSFLPQQTRLRSGRDETTVGIAVLPPLHQAPSILLPSSSFSSGTTGSVSDRATTTSTTIRTPLRGDCCGNFDHQETASSSHQQQQEELISHDDDDRDRNEQEDYDDFNFWNGKQDYRTGQQDNNSYKHYYYQQQDEGGSQEKGGEGASDFVYGTISPPFLGATNSTTAALSTIFSRNQQEEGTTSFINRSSTSSLLFDEKNKNCDTILTMASNATHFTPTTTTTTTASTTTGNDINQQSFSRHLNNVTSSNHGLERNDTSSTNILGNATAGVFKGKNKTMEELIVENESLIKMIFPGGIEISKDNTTATTNNNNKNYSFSSSRPLTRTEDTITTTTTSTQRINQEKASIQPADSIEAYSHQAPPSAGAVQQGQKDYNNAFMMLASPSPPLLASLYQTNGSRLAALGKRGRFFRQEGGGEIDKSRVGSNHEDTSSRRRTTGELFGPIILSSSNFRCEENNDQGGRRQEADGKKNDDSSSPNYTCGSIQMLASILEPDPV